MKVTRNVQRSATSSPSDKWHQRPGTPAKAEVYDMIRSPRKRGNAAASGLPRCYDTLIRTAGLTPGALTDQTTLFTSNGARTRATTNNINGSTLPSDQSHVTLALRVFTWYRNPILRIPGGAPGEVATTGDFDNFSQWLVGGSAVGQAAGTVQDVYRLHWQTEEQLHWTFGTGLKPMIDNMPTWYFPTGGGLWGTLACQTDLIHFSNRSTRGVSCEVNLGEFRRAYSETTLAKVILTEAEMRSRSQDRATRNEQRLDVRPLRPMIVTSAQLSGATGDEEIVQVPTATAVAKAKGHQPEWGGSTSTRPFTARAVSNNRVNSVNALQTTACEPILSETVNESMGASSCVGGTCREQGVSRLGDNLLTSARHLTEVMMCSTPMRKHGNIVSHTGILRLARAVLIPPRQNIICEATIYQLPDAGAAVAFGTVQGGNRNMLSLKDNLNAVDGIQKVITFTFDGRALQPRRAVASTQREEAVAKPTSYEERPAILPSQPRSELAGNSEWPRETCMEPDRVTARAKCGVHAAGALRVLNGGRACRAVSRLSARASECKAA